MITDSTSMRKMNPTKGKIRDWSIIMAITFVLYVVFTLLIQGFLAALGVEYGLNIGAVAAGLIMIVVTLLMNFLSVKANLRKLAA